MAFVISYLVGVVMGFLFTSNLENYFTTKRIKPTNFDG
ncbi:hypothetical protein ADIWIN_3870 [Winogradskyella psychrotolerans RS-3]|uniref:Uncharacterized protein n=1 Tax=Winogradskyella psychrotolerans RS-3 TaxID=641526 RepID=S7VKF9_9FLAO|nr:hypothetical protein ADIWIN_3870 [Winogradskyella psychrotolerans RS-3]